MYRPTRLRTRAAFDDGGRLLALIADGEDTDEEGSPLAFLDVEEGQAAPGREQIAAALAELDRDALQEVIDAAIAEGQAIGASEDPITPEVLARINALADAREAAEERIEAIATEEQQAQEARDAALARLAPRSDTDPDGEGDGDGDGDGEGSGDGDGEGQSTEGQPAPQAVNASSRPAGRRRQTSALPRPGSVPSGGASARGRQQGQQHTEPTFSVPRATTALVAAAGNTRAGLEDGAVITSAETLGEAINQKRHALRNVSGGNGENVPVASLRTTFPADRMLGDDAAANTRLIDAAAAPEVLVASAAHATANGAVVAAGGLCAPINIDYDVPVLGSVARPVRDALTNYGVQGQGGGGIRWRQHLSFGDFAGATGVWTLQNDRDQSDPGAADPTPKPCLEVECPDDAEAYVEAITLCLQFSNMTARFDPQATAANVAAAQVAHARLSENRLMTQIAALSTTLTAPAVVSAVRDDLLAMDRLLSAFRNFYRLDDNVALRAVRPLWWRDAIRADLMLGMGVGSGQDLREAMAVANATINAWYAARNVNITWHLDGRPATVAGVGEVTMADQFYGAFTDNGAVPDWPGTVETLLWREGDMLHLDGGTLDFGVVRDSTLNQVNRYKQFSESFEGVAHRGVECIRLVSALAPTGMTAGTADTAAILAA
jgi:hypothetical protein